MKELSIKEKAERYEKALMWMYGLYPTMEGAMKEDAEHYFPELKEKNEDEKIRNTIFDCLYKCCDSGVITREQRHICIAWLEKQKSDKFNDEKDEKIRKELIAVFKSIMTDADEDELWYGLPYNDIISWLEKQDNNPTPININKMVMEYGQTKDSDFGLPVNCMIRAYRQGIIDVLNLSSGIEKQNKQIHANSTKTCEDEQKSMDKVEPKFKKD